MDFHLNNTISSKVSKLLAETFVFLNTQNGCIFSDSDLKNGEVDLLWGWPGDLCKPDPTPRLWLPDIIFSKHSAHLCLFQPSCQRPRWILNFTGSQVQWLDQGPSLWSEPRIFSFISWNKWNCIISGGGTTQTGEFSGICLLSQYSCLPPQDYVFSLIYCWLESRRPWTGEWFLERCQFPHLKISGLETCP